ncbi:MAG: transporter substrate-binding domain-containing protein [Candidatus Binatia bacterium]
MATSGDYAPFSYNRTASTPGSAPALEGFDIEVARLFAVDRGYRLEFVTFRWPDLSRDLAAASFDVAMSGITRRVERSVGGRFSVPVAATYAIAVTWKASGITNFEELDRPHRRVAVNAGGHLERVAREALKRADVVSLADNDAVRMALLDRTFDAVVTDNFEARVWTEPMRDAVRIGPLSDDRKAYLLPAERRELAMELDLWILAREKDGTLENLRRRHFGEEPSSSPTGATRATAEPFAALADAVAERLALMPLVYEAKKAAGSPVEDTAREEVVYEEAQRAVAAAFAARQAMFAGGAKPAPAEVPPQPDLVRNLFQAMIAAGKDAQRALAEADARQRPGVVKFRPPAGEEPTTEGDATAAATLAAPSAVPTPADEAKRNRAAEELSSKIRPAIGRLSDKIACILVSMDEEITLREAKARIGNLLAPHRVKAEYTDTIAAAAAQISSNRAGK